MVQKSIAMHMDQTDFAQLYLSSSENNAGCSAGRLVEGIDAISEMKSNQWKL